MDSQVTGEPIPLAWRARSAVVALAALLVWGAPAGGAPVPEQAGHRENRAPAGKMTTTGHVVILTPHTGRVVIAEDADNDGLAEAIAVADNVTPFEDVPEYDGPGSVVRNDVGLAVLTDVPARKLVFRLIGPSTGRVRASPGAAVDLPQQWFAVVVLDDSTAPMPLALLDGAFRTGQAATCLPRCTWQLDHGATSCNAICTEGCAACGQWQGSPRCACAPLRDTPAMVP